jgi:bifunctional non-homologous end joining protein LigD
MIDLRSIDLMHGFKSPQPFSRDGWIFELKWDGYRVLASRTQLLTRNKKDATSWYPETVAALAKLKGDFVIDGEVCLLDDRGLPRFEEMRSRTMRRGGDLVTLFAFDLLFLDGKDLRPFPLVERKRQLKKLMPKKHARLVYVDHIETEGEFVFKGAVKAGMEGVMAKRAESPYVGERSRDWLKFKAPGHHDGWERPRAKKIAS